MNNDQFIEYLLKHPTGRSAAHIMSHFGISYQQFSTVKYNIIRKDVLPKYVNKSTGTALPLAYRYDQRTNLYHLGSDALGATEDDFRQFLRWTLGYTSTRAIGIRHHLKAFKASFPQKASKLRELNDILRYANNTVSEIDNMLAKL